MPDGGFDAQKRQLAEATRLLQETKRQLDARARELAAREAALSQREAGLAQRERQLQEREASLEPLESRLQEDARNAAAYKEQLISTARQLAEKEAELERREAALAPAMQSVREVEALRSRLAEQERGLLERERALRERERSIGEKLAAAEGRAREAEERLRQIAAKEEELAAVEAQMKNHALELQKRSAALDRRAKELEALAASRAEVERNMVLQAEKERALAQRERALGQREMELKGLEAKLKEKEAALETRGREVERQLSTGRAELSKKAEELETHRRALMERIEALRLEAEKLSQIPSPPALEDASATELAGRLDKMSARVRELEEKLRELEMERDAARGRALELEKNLVSRENDIVALKARLAAISTGAAGVAGAEQAELNKLTESLRARETELGRKEEALAERERRLEERARDMDLREQHLFSMEEEIASCPYCNIKDDFVQAERLIREVRERGVDVSQAETLLSEAKRLLGEGRMEEAIDASWRCLSLISRLREGAAPAPPGAPEPAPVLAGAPSAQRLVEALETAKWPATPSGPAGAAVSPGMAVGTPSGAAYAPAPPTPSYPPSAAPERKYEDEVEAVAKYIEEARASGIKVGEEEGLLEKAREALRSSRGEEAGRLAAQALETVQKRCEDYNRASNAMNALASSIKEAQERHADLILTEVEGVYREAWEAFESGNYAAAAAASEKGLERLRELEREHEARKAPPVPPAPPVAPPSPPVPAAGAAASSAPTAPAAPETRPPVAPKKYRCPRCTKIFQVTPPAQKTFDMACPWCKSTIRITQREEKAPAGAPAAPLQQPPEEKAAHKEGVPAAAVEDASGRVEAAKKYIEDARASGIKLDEATGLLAKAEEALKASQAGSAARLAQEALEKAQRVCEDYNRASEAMTALDSGMRQAQEKYVDIIITEVDDIYRKAWEAFEKGDYAGAAATSSKGLERLKELEREQEMRKGAAPAEGVPGPAAAREPGAEATAPTEKGAGAPVPPSVQPPAGPKRYKCPKCTKIFQVTPPTKRPFDMACPWCKTKIRISK
ncbi:MAG: hypothetical protein QXW06_03290 [Thermoplasmata archaeon]